MFLLDGTRLRVKSDPWRRMNSSRRQRGRHVFAVFRFAWKVAPQFSQTRS